MIEEGKEMHTLSEICRAWELAPILSATTPATGTIHNITILETKEARYVLRAYKYALKERQRIVCEHALTTYVQAHGFSAIAPLALPSGETILEYEGRFYALFPYARGQQISRQHLTSPEMISAMGQCLAHLHRILNRYPYDNILPLSCHVERQETLSQIETLEATIQHKASLDTHDQQALMLLRQRREWLSTASPIDPQGFLALEQQVIHGDYQETNLFFAEKQVSAIIDWDKACIAPRAYEILRTLHYVFHLDPVRCQIFLTAYRNVFPLSSDDLDEAAKFYGWLQDTSVWLYTAYYLKNNFRVAVFFPSGPFVPFEKLWRTVRQYIREI